MRRPVLSAKMHERGYMKNLLRSAQYALLAAASLAPLQAASFELIFNGTFNTSDALNPATAGSPVFFSGVTPYTATAVFDTNSPNLVSVLPPPLNQGFVAYSPSYVAITVGGQTYTVSSYNDNPTAGVSIAIFDKTSIFGAPPGRYAVGLLQDPVNDGAGFVGDFQTATPDFLVTNLVSTVFGGYAGVGFGSGVNKAITPIPLFDSAHNAFALTLGNYDECHECGNPVPVNTAQLIALPEPGTLGLAGLALTMLGVLRRVRA
jgi:hypothetical protein